MSNLIITIIAIALVALAALMAAYYGGTSFNKGQDKARALSLANQREQVKMAAALYKTKENETVGNIADLTGNNYMINIGNENQWLFKDETAYIIVSDTLAEATKMCEQIYLMDHTDLTGFDMDTPCSTITTDQVCCYQD